MSKHVLITGGTGLIGARLTELLLEKKYTVSHLSRSEKPDSAVKMYKWDIEKKEIDPTALQKTDFIIHLAGANLADHRWTNSYKQTIIKSRTESTHLLYNTIKNLRSHTIQAFISASAIGIYGDTGSAKVIESSPPGHDFAATVVEKWEAAVDKIKELNIRVVKLRTGIVLSKDGGILKKLIPVIKLGAGAPLGSGMQYQSWIHLDDLCYLYIEALENPNFQGIYNAVGPKPVTNEALTKAVAKVLDKPLFLPNVPAFAMKLALGEMATIALASNRVSSRKIEEAGFKFQYSNLEQALRNILLDKK